MSATHDPIEFHRLILKCLNPLFTSFHWIPLQCGLCVSPLIRWLFDCFTCVFGFGRLSAPFDLEACTTFLGIILKLQLFLIILIREKIRPNFLKNILSLWNAHTKWKAINSDWKTIVICIIIMKRVNTQCAQSKRYFTVNADRQIGNQITLP